MNCSTKPKPPNRFGATCIECGGWVAPEAGFLIGRDQSTGRWEVLCEPCLSYLSPPPRPTPPRTPACLAVLGLKPPATRDQVKSAYRQLALVHHPDRGGHASVFNRVNQCYQEALLLARG